MAFGSNRRKSLKEWSAQWKHTRGEAQGPTKIVSTRFLGVRVFPTGQEAPEGKSSHAWGCGMAIKENARDL